MTTWNELHASADNNQEATKTGFVGFITNIPLVAAFFSFLFAQVAKVFTAYYEDERWDFSRLVGSGGMPSSHTAFVVGLTTAVGVVEGTGSSVFAACIVMSLVVMYDATGVRQHAGRHASVLNMIISEMPADHPVQDTGRLHHLLGHTPAQVAAGAAVGLVIGLFVALIFN